MSDAEKQRMFEAVERIVAKLAQAYKLTVVETQEFQEYVAAKWAEKYSKV